MKRLLITVCALCFIIIAKAQQPYVQKLDDVAQITFPDTPKLKIRQGIKIYALNHGPVYLAQVTDYTKKLGDYLAGSFADSLYRGYAEGISKGGKIVYHKKITNKGLSGYVMIAKVQVEGGVNYRYHELFYFNRKLVTFGIWSTDSVSLDHPGIKSFFDSFKPTIKSDKIEQGDSADLGHTAGNIVGDLLTIATLGAVITIIVVAIILIAKRVKKNKNGQS